MKNARSRKQKKSKSFNPNRAYIDDAVKDYLKKGGKIKRIEPVYQDELDYYAPY